MKKQTVIVNDKMQSNYRYIVSEPVGQNFNAEFKPELIPKQMLEMGVFGGRYMRDCQKEFPINWFTNAKLAHKNHDSSLNFFGVNASQPLSVWRKKDWIHPDDPRGWFQWYCRYFVGRRMLEEDKRQIKRWKGIHRHISQLKKHCQKGDITCRPIQRQALLHWAYDSRKM